MFIEFTRPDLLRNDKIYNKYPCVKRLLVKEEMSGNIYTVAEKNLRIRIQSDFVFGCDWEKLGMISWDLSCSTNGLV